jgi:uncharacterized protein (DUF2236 family)
MVGLPGQCLPRDRAALGAYLGAVLSDGTIAVGSVARDLAGALARPRFPAGTDRFFRVYARLTVAVAAALLPEVLREQYAGVLPRRPGRLYRLAGRAGRAVVGRLPVSARTDPLAARAIRRATGRPGARGGAAQTEADPVRVGGRAWLGSAPTSGRAGGDTG